MKQAAAFHDKKRLFFSTLMNDNLLDCILSKVEITEKAPKVCCNLSFHFLIHMSYLILINNLKFPSVLYSYFFAFYGGSNIAFLLVDLLCYFKMLATIAARFAISYSAIRLLL